MGGQLHQFKSHQHQDQVFDFFENVAFISPPNSQRLRIQKNTQPTALISSRMTTSLYNADIRSNNHDANAPKSNASNKNKMLLNPRSIAIDALTISQQTHARKYGQNDSNNNRPLLKTFPTRKLETNPNYQNLPSARDRAYARLLVATVERRMGQIDSILGLIAKTYPPKKV